MRQEEVHSTLFFFGFFLRIHLFLSITNRFVGRRFFGVKELFFLVGFFEAIENIN